jgi:hypothetical protein
VDPEYYDPDSSCEYDHSRSPSTSQNQGVNQTRINQEARFDLPTFLFRHFEDTNKEIFKARGLFLREKQPIFKDQLESRISCYSWKTEIQPIKKKDYVSV